MMEITHEEAQRLIQLVADDSLQGSERNILDAHLQSCAECCKYADSMQAVASLLQPLLQRRWSHQPLPHLSNQWTSSAFPKISPRSILVTRITAMSLICVAFLVAVWQSVQPSNPQPGMPSVSVPPMPTPSLQLTSTLVTNPGCEPVSYTVQENDTLASIADDFSLSREEVMAANDMKTETVLTSMELLIPVCSPTQPASSSTTTITPWTESPIATPVTVRTQ